MSVPLTKFVSRTEPRAKTSVFGIGVATPPHTMTQDQALELAERVLRIDSEKARVLRAIYRRAGVKQRYTCVPYETGYAWAELPDAVSETGEQVPRGASTRVRMQLYQQYAPPLALDAASKAMDESDVPRETITHLVTASCTGFVAPGVDSYLINQLGLPADTQRVNVGFMGCHGAINALRVADGLAASDPNNRVLLCCVELCSLHYFFDSDPDKLVSNALFADGAAALVLGGAGEGDPVWRLRATGSCLLPDSLDAMTWDVGDYGFEMSLSAAVPDRIAESLRPWLTGWLDQQGVAMEDVTHWAVHPGGPRILSSVSESLELDAEALAASRSVLADYGNMSSPTVLFIAEELSRRGATGPCVMLAFGPGLAAEVALIEF
ncbi:MAG: type III polyketide synthase [Planctomycetota bacterium]